MSASTVSATANNSTAIRRKPTSSVAGDVKHAVDIVNETSVSPIVDQGHSIRGESVTLKKSQLPASSNPPPRSRIRKVSAPTKPVKRNWVTVLSVLAKNLLVVFVLLGLFQIVTKLVIDSRNGHGYGSDRSAGFADLEGRIAQVESSLKTNSKMLQVQVEVVDKKVESLVGDLKKDVSKKIEDNNENIATRLQELNERNEVLAVGWSELRSKDLATKEDLVRLYDELKNDKGGGVLDGIELGWDEIRALARDVVEKEIEKHAADGLGRVDYALASGGAIVAKHSEPFMVGKMGNWFSGTNRQGVHTDAYKMLKPSFGEPGQCFPLKGTSGFVEIRLRKAIFPEAFTLEHVAKSVAYDQSSAPKHCRVSGWQQSLDTELGANSLKMVHLTEFTYDLERSNAQTFNVFDSATSALIDTVRFEFTSNHGSPSHTCIYRFRVHGREPDMIQMVAAES